jgi:hypothetical protein
MNRKMKEFLGVYLGPYEYNMEGKLHHYLVSPCYLQILSTSYQG